MISWFKYVWWRIWRRDLVAVIVTRKANRPVNFNPAERLVFAREEAKAAILALEAASYLAGYDAAQREALAENAPEPA